MKNKLIGGWLVAAAVTAVCLVGGVSCASAQPAGPDPTAPNPVAPETTVALPPDIAPDSPLGQVVKLVQAGVDPVVIKTFINNSGSAFNLNAERIIALTDLGVPTDIVNAMMEQDKKIYSATTLPPPSAPAPANVEVNPTLVAPSAPVTVEYFDNTLSPYGSWVVVEGYGRCWRPTTVIYDSTWQPYSDRGHWVYSDCGWYWDSDYSWGATFHYGRWFRHERMGWCWWPDTVWAPSWVTWRQSDAYCGWAPLPPFAVYRPGFGFSYRGASVGIGFDFGLSAGCFTFVSVGNFCDRHPRYYRAESRHRDEIFHQTTVINNYQDNRTTIINGGISVDRVRGATHRPIPPVAVSELPNAGRHGWRGDNTDRSERRPGTPSADNRAGGNAAGTSHGTGIRSDRNNEANANHRPEGGQANALPNRNDKINSPARPPSPEQTGNRNGPRDRGINNRNSNSSPPSPPNPTSPANNRLMPGPPLNRPQPSPGTPENRQAGGNDRSQSQYNRNQQPAPFTPANNAPAQNPPPAGNNRPAPGTPFVRPQPAQSLPDNRQSGGNDRNQSQYNRNQQPAPFTPAYNAPAASAPPPRSSPQIQQRQFTPPPAMPVPPQREPRVEQRQSPPVSAPRYEAPPSAPSQPPAQSQPHNSGQNPNRGSDRDKQNH